MTKNRFMIEVISDEDWLIQDTLTGADYNPIDGTANVLNGLINLLNSLSEENEQLKKQLMKNTCDNCIYSKAIYIDVECRKKGFTGWDYNCDEFKGDVE